MAESEPYHYRQCGLADVYLVNGYERNCTAYGETITIHNIDELHRAIGTYLVEEKEHLTGAEIRFLRHELDLSQDMLGRLLGKTGQTVARWEKGQCAIDGSAVRLLRAYYEAKVGRTPNKVTSLLERLAEFDGEYAGYPVEFALEDMDSGKWKVHDAA